MKTYRLFLTSAIALAGMIQKAGAIVEVDEPRAKNLLGRGKARLPTPEELQAAGYAPEQTDEDADNGDSGTNPPPPTRADLDAALAALPGEYTDADYVVNGMRAHYGDLFTAKDEKAVRKVVKPAAAPAK